MKKQSFSYILFLAPLALSLSACVVERESCTDALEALSQQATLPVCESSYHSPVAVEMAQVASVVEASGLVASRQNLDILWLHNDSGDDAVVYAFTTEGEYRGRLELVGAEATDIEDIALAACPRDPETDCLWLADLGNNNLDRDDLGIWVVAEPVLDPDEVAPQIWTDSAFLHLPAKVDGDEADIEALAVSPDGLLIYAFEKIDSTTARYFVAHLSLNSELVFTSLGELSVPGLNVEHGHSITGADLHPGAERLLLRVYTVSLEYRLNSSMDMARLSELTPIEVFWGPIDEGQGEAIAYDSDGLGILTISEDPAKEVNQPLHYYGCSD